MARCWTDCAELVATQGLKGRFVARSSNGLPFLLEEGMKVHFVPPTLEGPRTAVINTLTHQGSGDYLVDFSTVKDRDTAESLVSCHVLVSNDQLPENLEDIVRSTPQALCGLSVMDEQLGLLGTIQEVSEMPTQDLLIVEGPFGEVLIPFVDEFILGFDEDDEDLLWVRIPNGLVDASLVEEETWL
ncbi:MAG: 16S rRNA processing protein RimM [Eggerthellales bacterium]|nr:16S rRNA processing protein RimM [Eggerthellales bacterium]